MKDPAFGLDREIRPSALDTDEGDEDVGRVASAVRVFASTQ